MKGLIRFLVWCAIVVGLVVGIARLTAVRWLRVPTNDPVFSTSLIPSIWPGDLILLWRLTTPAFGELVLCPEPNYPERYVIGRIVGIAGDSVVLENGEPYTNGEEFVEERACTPQMITYPHPDDSAEEVTQQCHWEAMANKLHQVGSTQGHDVRPEDRQYDVPEGHYFLISDNRLFPYDSRDYGFVEASSCKETVVGRLVSRKGWADSENRLDYIQ